MLGGFAQRGVGGLLDVALVEQLLQAAHEELIARHSVVRRERALLDHGGWLQRTSGSRAEFCLPLLRTEAIQLYSPC